MFVVDVWTSVVPSACSWSVGNPLGVSTIAANEAQVASAYRISRAWSLSCAVAGAGRANPRTKAAAAIVIRIRLMVVLLLLVGGQLEARELRNRWHETPDIPPLTTIPQDASVGRSRITSSSRRESLRQGSGDVRG